MKGGTSGLILSGCKKDDWANVFPKDDDDLDSNVGESELKARMQPPGYFTEACFDVVTVIAGWRTLPSDGWAPIYRRFAATSSDGMVKNTTSPKIFEEFLTSYDGHMQQLRFSSSRMVRKTVHGLVEALGESSSWRLR